MTPEDGAAAGTAGGSLPWPGDFGDRMQDWRTAAIAIGMVFAFAAPILYLGSSGGLKAAVGSLGIGAFLLVAYVSGNIRLFCLWGLMITLPFDLSKRFGPSILKMGGESSFRIEMSDPFLLALAFFIVAELWDGRRRGLSVPRVAYIWALLMLFGVASIITGPWRTTAAHEVFRMLKTGSLFIVLSNELRRPRQFLHLAAGLALAVLIQAVTGLLQWVLETDLGLQLLGETGPLTIELLADSTVRGESVYRVGAFLAHPNIFGTFLGVLLPMAIALFLLRVGWITRGFLLITITLGMAALIVTLSRAGWLSFFVASTVMVSLLILHTGMQKRSLLAAGAAGMALLCVLIVFAGPIASRLFDSRPDAMLGRAEYVADAKAMIAEKPLLGFGLNSYVLAAPPYTQYGARGAVERYKNWLPPAHNIYYVWWVETGIVGLLIFVWLLATIVKQGFANLWVRNEILFAVNAAALAGLLGFVADGFFSFTFRINGTQRVFWVLAAVIMAVHYWQVRQDAATRGRPQRLTSA